MFQSIACKLRHWVSQEGMDSWGGKECTACSCRGRSKPFPCDLAEKVCRTSYKDQRNACALCLPPSIFSLMMKFFSFFSFPPLLLKETPMKPPRQFCNCLMTTEYLTYLCDRRLVRASDIDVPCKHHSLRGKRQGSVAHPSRSSLVNWSSFTYRNLCCGCKPTCKNSHFNIG